MIKALVATALAAWLGLAGAQSFPEGLAAFHKAEVEQVVAGIKAENIRVE